MRIGSPVQALLLCACLTFSGCATNLYYTIHKGDETRALELIEEGKGLNYRDEMGYTPLHVATYQRNAKLVEALLDAGAETDAKSFEGFTPMHIAAHDEQAGSDILQPLIEHGADVEATDPYGQTPLMLVCQRGTGTTDGHEQALVVQELLDAGADVTSRDAKGMTALHHAAKSGQSLAVADLLIESGADIQSHNAADRTPLHLAAANDRLGMAAHLLDAGAEPELIMENKATTVVPWGEYDIRHEYEVNAKTYNTAGAWYAQHGDKAQAAEYFQIAGRQYAFAEIEYTLWAESFEAWIKDAKAETFRKNVAAIALTAAGMATGVPISLSPDSSHKADYFKNYSGIYYERARMNEEWAMASFEAAQELEEEAEAEIVLLEKDG